MDSMESWQLAEQRLILTFEPVITGELLWTSGYRLLGT